MGIQERRDAVVNWLWAALGIVALFALIGFALWRGSGKAARGVEAENQMEAIDEAHRLRHRLRTQRAFAERMRAKFTR